MSFTLVCQSVHRGRGYSTMSRPVWMPGSMFLPWKRVSVSGSMFLLAQSLSLVPCYFWESLSLVPCYFWESLFLVPCFFWGFPDRNPLDRDLLGQRHSLDRDPLDRDLLGQRHSLDREPLDKDLLGQRHSLDREPADRDPQTETPTQRAGGTHLTGMHSCIKPFHKRFSDVRSKP